MPDINFEERKGLIRNGGGGGPSSPTSSGIGSNSGSSSSSLAWKITAFVLFALIILFVTDVLEFKQTSVDGNSKSVVGAGSVVKKGKHVSSDTTNVDDPENISKNNDQNQEENKSEGSGETIVDIKTEANNEESPKETSPPAQAVTPNPTPEPSPAPIAPPEEEKLDAADDKDKNLQSTSTTNQKSVVATSAPGYVSRHIYVPRGQPMSDETRKAMIDKWGSWSLKDGKDRPTDDYYAAYPNRDIPRDKFPSNAWQVDKEYLSKFLPECIQLVDRAYNAIMEEYGQPNDGSSKLFHVEKFDVWDGDKHPCRNQAGCTTIKSWNNLIRRLLHAIMTEDMFVLAMGGHSAAAGHGNHFQQSYTLQVQWILEAVFARLGSRHQSRNFGLGGLGTVQSGLATKSIYGYDVDMLLWDSGMTEKDPRDRDVLFRQGMLGPGKVPVIMSLSGRSDVIKTLGDDVDADFIMVGDQKDELPEGTSLEEIQKMPWALQYVKCNSEMSQTCRANEYAGECWIDRDDFTPPNKQGNVGGRASWHPGNRKHQHTGRALAVMILEALKEALTMWNDATDYELPDEAWHVTEVYDNIRMKLEQLPLEKGSCNKFQDTALGTLMCNTPIKGRTEFTPRVYPDHTSIRSLMPTNQLNEIDDPPENIYNPPDIFNPNLHPPNDEVDVLNIVEAGIDFREILSPDYTNFWSKPKFQSKSKFSVGKGHHLNTIAGYCDGSVDSWCKRQADNNCLLYGHNDGRNGILMNSVSGWMVLNLPDVKAGFIALKFQTWHWPEDNPRTKDWTTINNERRKLIENNDNTTTSLYLRSNTRHVNTKNITISSIMQENNYEIQHPRRELGKKPVPEYCNDFRFEYAIDGEITSLTKDQFLERNAHVQRVVEVFKVVDDPMLTGGQEKEIELAFRLFGCGNVKNFQLTHVYWA